MKKLIPINAMIWSIVAFQAYTYSFNTALAFSISIAAVFTFLTIMDEI